MWLCGLPRRHIEFGGLVRWQMPHATSHRLCIDMTDFQLCIRSLHCAAKSVTVRSCT